MKRFLLILALAIAPLAHSMNKQAALPDELFTAFKVVAEQAEQMGATPELQNEIVQLVDRYYSHASNAEKQTLITIFNEDIHHPLTLDRAGTPLTAPLNKIAELVFDMKHRMSGLDKNMPIVYTSFGSGDLLIDFWAVRELQKDGFRNITVNIIDSDYIFKDWDEKDADYYLATQDTVYGFAALLKQQLNLFLARQDDYLNVYDLTQPARVDCVNVFSNAYDYIHASSINPALKSTIITAIQSIGGRFTISDPSFSENKEEKAYMLTLTLPQQDDFTTGAESEESADVAPDHAKERPSYGDIFISFIEKDRTSVYIHESRKAESSPVLRAVFDILQSNSNPHSVKAALQEQFPEIIIDEMSNTIGVLRDLIEEALADNGTAYLLEEDDDERTSFTHNQVKIITRSEYDPHAYDADARAEERIKMKEWWRYSLVNGNN